MQWHSNFKAIEYVNAATHQRHHSNCHIRTGTDHVGNANDTRVSAVAVANINVYAYSQFICNTNPSQC